MAVKKINFDKSRILTPTVVSKIEKNDPCPVKIGRVDNEIHR